MIFHIVFIVSALVAGVTSECDTGCMPSVEKHGKYLCIPNSPTQFVICSHGRRFEFTCPTGTVFDPTTSVCNWAWQASECTCSDSTTSTPTTSATSRSTGTTPTVTTSKAITPTTTTTTATTTTRPSGGSSKSVICYYTNWAQYRQGAASFKPINIDATLCTHIIYAFLNFDTSTLKTREWNDAITVPKIMALKSVNPNLKVIASIGGWNAGTSVFRQIIATRNSRSRFNRGAINFLRQFRFDGLDIDMEYPGDAGSGSPVSDKPLFTAWMRSLRSDFEADAERSGNPRLLLGIAVAASIPKLQNGYQIPALSQELDFISVTSYDYHGSWDSVTGFNAPLYPKSSWSNDLHLLTVSSTIDYLISKGAAHSKVMMGIPLYGRSFTLSNPRNSAVGARAVGPGKIGSYTGEAGYNSYYETCMLSKCSTTPYSYVFDRETKTPFMFQGTNWITTEDVESVKAKVAFAMAKNLGGVMFWAMDLDDFGDLCKNGMRYPLMNTAINTLRGLPPPALTTTNKSPSMCSAV